MVTKPKSEVPGGKGSGLGELGRRNPTSAHGGGTWASVLWELYGVLCEHRESKLSRKPDSEIQHSEYII